VEPLGGFASSVKVGEGGGIEELEFSTPAETVGSVSLRGCRIGWCQKLDAL